MPALMVEYGLDIEGNGLTAVKNVTKFSMLGVFLFIKKPDTSLGAFLVFKV